MNVLAGLPANVSAGMWAEIQSIAPEISLLCNYLAPFGFGDRNALCSCVNTREQPEGRPNLILNRGLFSRRSQLFAGRFEATSVDSNREKREMKSKLKPADFGHHGTVRFAESGPTRPLILAIVLCLVFISNAMAQSTDITCAIKGSVFVTDSGGPSYVPGAKVSLQGPETDLQAETDAEGRYTFCEVKAGTYSIEASFPGLQVAQGITVESGAASEVDLELKPVAVTTSVTVADTAGDEKVSTITETITEKIIADAPNVNERFESLLPMVPGVVRGPDGRINMKGARSTQSGALVNSANVTDPATGSPAINLPIDVVSSVQVISNPYDPQYGKLTGAVSSVGTKTGNYDHSHFSIQNVLPRCTDGRWKRDGNRISDPAYDLHGSLD